MPIITGNSREAKQQFCLEDLIEPESWVRVIDTFVDTLDLEALGFQVKGGNKEGRPAFTAETLLRIYLYGYLNRTRSSRQLEKACICNVEMWWLTGQQQPCYKVISDFRKDNKSHLKKVFDQWNLFCKDWGLFGEEGDDERERKTVAIDGSKFRAQNSKKNNFNKKKVERQLKYIDKKQAENMELLNELKEQGVCEPRPEVAKQELEEKLTNLKERREKYEEIGKRLAELEKTGETQVSLVDEDARSLPEHMNIVNVGYNLLTGVHGKHSLIADFEVINKKDDQALSGIAITVKEFLGLDEMNALTDQGFSTGRQLHICAENNIITYAAPKTNTSRKDPDFTKDKFQYNEELDCYECPAGELLKTNGTWYEKNKNKPQKNYKFQRYEAPLEKCRQCEFQDKCGPFSRGHGRYIERTEYDEAVEKNRARVAANKELYRLRQRIVEHPYGTIKRSWGYTYTLLRGLEKVNGEFSLINVSYNIRRVITILGVPMILAYLKEVKAVFSTRIRLVLRIYARFLLFCWVVCLQKLNIKVPLGEKELARKWNLGELR